MQLLTAIFAKNGKTARRVYHARRCNDGTIQLWATDQLSTAKRPIVTWDKNIDPLPAAILAIVCRVHLQYHAPRGWHRIG